MSQVQAVCPRCLSYSWAPQRLFDGHPDFWPECAACSVPDFPIYLREAVPDPYPDPDAVLDSALEGRPSGGQPRDSRQPDTS